MNLCERSIGFVFFFNETATTEIYTLSLHDALPIFGLHLTLVIMNLDGKGGFAVEGGIKRSEEHTSELQSHSDLVCRLLLEKKNQLVQITTCRKCREA